MQSRLRKTRLAVPAVVLSLALVGAACGDDKKESTTNTTQGGGAQAGGDLAAFCDGFVVLSSAQFGPPAGDPEAAAADVKANAPEEIADEVDTLLAEMQKMMAEEGGEGEGGDSGDSSGATSTTAAGSGGNFAGQQDPTETTVSESPNGTATSGEGEEGGGEGGPPSAEFLAASAVVGEYAANNCADEQIEVTAKDYEYEGLPTTLTAGEYGVLMTNEGQEWHETIIMKKNDGVTESFEELAALPEEEAMEKVTILTAAFAGPGQQSGTVVDLEAGEYAAICFIPVGTTSLEAQVDGPPHFTEGMVHPFTVTA